MKRAPRPLRLSWKLDGAVRQLRLTASELEAVRSLPEPVAVAARAAHAELVRNRLDAGDDDVRELLLCRAGHVPTVRRIHVLAGLCPRAMQADLTDSGEG